MLTRLFYTQAGTIRCTVCRTYIEVEFPLQFRTMHQSRAIVAACLLLTCAFSQAEEAATPLPITSLNQAALAWSNTAQEVLLGALSLTGVRYAFGGKSPETGFDCSGFVRYVFEQATHLTLPHGARAISQIGQAIPLEQLQPGDLVFFDTLKSAFSHVGIYMGEGRFIHAPSSGGGVRVVDMNDGYWTKRFNGARRLPVYAQMPAAISAE